MLCALILYSSTTSKNDTSDDDENDLQLDVWKYHKLITHKNMKQKSTSTIDTVSVMEIEVQMYLSSPVISIQATQSSFRRK